MGDEYEMSPERIYYLETVLPKKRDIGRLELYKSGIPEYCYGLLTKIIKGNGDARAELEYILQNIMTPLSPEDAATFGVHMHPGFHIERVASNEDEDFVQENPAHPGDFMDGWPEQKAAIMAGGEPAILKLLGDLFMLDSRAKSKSGDAYNAHVLKWKLDDILISILGTPTPAPAAIGRGHTLVGKFHNEVQGIREGVELIPTPPDTPVLEAEEAVAKMPALALPPQSPGAASPGRPGAPGPPSVRKLGKKRPRSNSLDGGGKRRTKKGKSRRSRRSRRRRSTMRA